MPAPETFIRIGAGTYHGPVTINKTLDLIGAGPASTIVRGGRGGPVVRVGPYNLSTGSTVSVTNLTVTGGRNTTYPAPSHPSGGGIRIEVGAKVTINSAHITGNSVRSSGTEACGSYRCATSGGGGIENLGTMTLNSSTVSNNAALITNVSADVKHANGGGIESAGTLHVNNSTISGNKLVVRNTSMQLNGNDVLGGGLAVGGPATIMGSRINSNIATVVAYTGGGGAGAGGIEQSGGSLLLANSEVSHNSARFTITSTQTSAAANTDGGAIEVNGELTVKHTRFIGNALNSTSPAALANGGTTAWGAAIFNPSPTPVTMTDIVVAGNTSVAKTTSGTASAWGAIFNGSPLTLVRAIIAGNGARATSASGTATAQGAGILIGSPLTLLRSTVRGNKAKATSSSGAATSQGAGILNNSSTLTLKSTVVTKNSGTVAGPIGMAQGGGIWNGDGGNGAPQLTLIGSVITHNVLSASNPKIKVQGGGLYTTAHATLKKTIIAYNAPDQCFGC